MVQTQKQPSSAEPCGTTMSSPASRPTTSGVDNMKTLQTSDKPYGVPSRKPKDAKGKPTQRPEDTRTKATGGATEVRDGLLRSMTPCATIAARMQPMQAAVRASLQSRSLADYSTTTDNPKPRSTCHNAVTVAATLPATSTSDSIRTHALAGNLTNFSDVSAKPSDATWKDNTDAGPQENGDGETAIGSRRMVSARHEVIGAHACVRVRPAGRGVS